MFEVELRVFPHGTGGPTMEVVHNEQNTQLAKILDLSIYDRH
jgi:hypothetical protein